MSSPLRTIYITQYTSVFNQSVCSACLRSLRGQWYRRHASTAAQILNSEDPKPDGRAPGPLSRPVGVPHPPQRGENSGIDTRSWRERKSDSLDYEKHLVRRKELYALSLSLTHSRLCTSLLAVGEEGCFLTRC